MLLSLILPRERAGLRFVVCPVSMMGIPVLVDDTVPVGVIQLRDAEGRMVGEIYNLATEENYNG